MPSLMIRRTIVLLLVSLSLGAGCRKDAEPLNTPAADAPQESELDGALEDVPAPQAAAPSMDEEVSEEAKAAALEEFVRQQDARFLNPEIVRTIQVHSGLIPPVPPEIDRLLIRADLREIMQYTGPMSSVPLLGRDVSSDYNAKRFSMGRELGCSIQRWQFRTFQHLAGNYERFRDTLIDAEQEARTDAATAHWVFGGVRSIVMMHAASLSMVQLSCTETMISRPQLRTLSERVLSRL